MSGGGEDDERRDPELLGDGDDFGEPGRGSAGEDGRLIGSLDAETGLIRLQAWVPGPAGESAIRLADGALELAVDHAEPEIVTGLTIDPRSARSLAVADGLLDGRAREVVDAADERSRVLWRPVRGPRRGASGTSAEAGRRAQIARLGRIAVLAAEVERADLNDLARALGMIELANAVDDTATRLGMTPSAPRLWRAGATRLIGLEPSWTEAIDAGAARQVAAVLMLARKGLIQVDSRLARAVDEIRARLAPRGRPSDPGDPSGPGRRRGSRPGDGSHPSGWATPSEQVDEEWAELFELEADEAPGVVAMKLDRAPAPSAPAAGVGATPAERVAALEAATPAAGVAVPVSVVAPVQVRVGSARHRGDAVEVSVRGEVDLDATWLRVFRLTDGARMRPVLVAMAPFRREGYGRARAVALVPEAMGAEPLSADITVSPDGPWVAPSLAQVADAIDAGRRACRAERGGDRPEAWELWQVCAERWAALGDPAREMQARNLSAGRPGRGDRSNRRRASRQPLPPFALDQLD